ncbi:hypothetical protein NMY22_g13130 [Coprinellus aureogranulatus]|nr:hypothetical protein NMY22_g13130 [Coprinellus aureogranulatus]
MVSEVNGLGQLTAGATQLAPDEKPTVFISAQPASMSSADCSIFMREVSWPATRDDVVLCLAERLHHANFMGTGEALHPKPNFDVYLFPGHRRGQRHSGKGKLLLPTVAIGQRFLDLYEGPGIPLKGRTIRFSLSKNPLGPKQLKILDRIRRKPYIDPRDSRAKEQQEREDQVAVQCIQFGWECRDETISIESEASPEDAFVSFDKETRRFRIQYLYGTYRYYIVVRYSQIEYLTAHTYQDEPAIVFTLFEPPMYEKDLRPSKAQSRITPLAPQEFPDLQGDSPIPQLAGPSKPDPTGSLFKLDFSKIDVAGIVAQFAEMFGEDSNAPETQVAPYTSLVLRLVCKDSDGPGRFIALAKEAGYGPNISSDPWDVAFRELFSGEALEEYAESLEQLPWSVAFQVEGIVRSRSVDIREMSDILPSIRELVVREGERFVALLLRDFAPKVYALYRDDDTVDAVLRCFNKTLEEFRQQQGQRKEEPVDGSLFESYRVTVTPTTMLFEGPSLEQSNRVIRTYGPEHHDSFLRVTFADDSRLHPRFEQEVDGARYVEARIKPLLFHGLDIAGHKFEFLGYSQSSLKEHSVWFVKPFKVSFQAQLVTASSIIASLGNFENLTYDPKLIYCPARYGARLSLAFTATEESISVDVDEIFFTEDITVEHRGQKYNHTDGVGTMSPEVAKEIAQVTGRPSAVIQVRVQGAKGMLSTNYKLQGRAIVLRPSMIKFDAPTATNIGIAGVFDRPMPYFLNRPLIMLLEGLGVPFETFKRFQDMAVRETHEASQSLSKAGKLFQCHGLGASFRIPSVMSSLASLGITRLVGDTFFDKCMEFAQNHVLRDLKHKARIRVPGAWTLVGVADEHGFLEPGQIFACIRQVGGEVIYLEGDVVISRSPTIHPGDVQIAYAIGRPPIGSCFDQERLENSVVFSIKGDRPLPSCLGGGDLDGDIFNIIPLNNPDLAGFRPSRVETPATYPPAERKVLDRPSNIKDVAQFFMDYLLSDVLGLIGSTWMVIADQATTQARHGIFDPDCITLANLNSDAADYPKSGKPVDRSKIPKWKRRQQPDWNAPETVDLQTQGDRFYESPCAIGRLFRAISLPADDNPRKDSTRVSTYRRKRRTSHLDQTNQPAGWSIFETDDIYLKIERRVEQLVPASDEPSEDQFHQDAKALNASLSEEEAMVGTIVQKTSQPRDRKTMISRLRESTDTLVRATRGVLEGGTHSTDDVYLRRAWHAFTVALENDRKFGAQSFIWVALGAIFEAIRRIEERD